IQRLLKVEADPTAAEVEGLDNRPALEHVTRVADGNHLVGPVGSGVLDLLDHLFRSQGGAGGHFARLLLAGGQQVHVRPADVNDQDVHGCFSQGLSHPTAARTTDHTSTLYEIGTPVG